MYMYVTELVDFDYFFHFLWFDLHLAKVEAQSKVI